MKKELRLKNQVGELERVNQFVEEIGEELGLDMELQMNLNLVMEDLAVFANFAMTLAGAVASVFEIAAALGPSRKGASASKSVPLNAKFIMVFL